MPKITLNIDELTTEKAELADFLASPQAFSDPAFSTKNKRFTELDAIIDKAKQKNSQRVATS
jgi:hypothetical protein